MSPGRQIGIPLRSSLTACAASVTMPAIHLAAQEQLVTGSTVKSDHTIGRDILWRLFEPVINGERFNLWWWGTDEPQLRLHGGPGSGKVCSDQS